jgi:hypothetical protein
MEFYSAIKKNEILSFAGKWMELENIILTALGRFGSPKTACFLRDLYKYTNIMINRSHIRRGHI